MDVLILVVQGKQCILQGRTITNPAWWAEWSWLGFPSYMTAFHMQMISGHDIQSAISRRTRFQAVACEEIRSCVTVDAVDKKWN